MAISKVIYGGDTLLDLTADTVTPDKLLTGITAHGKDGEEITGTCAFDADTSSATVTADEILIGKTAFARGSKVTGAMANNESWGSTIATKAGEVTILQGYHDGSGKVKIADAEQAKIIPNNIRSGVEILGVTGTMTGAESITSQAKSVTPKSTAQTITPDAGYDYLSQVTVAAIPYTETENSAGGITVTIG